MRSLRLVVPATLVILSLSFAPAQAATGDDPGGGGFLGQWLSSLTSSTADEPPPDPGDVADPPSTQPADPPPPPKELLRLPVTQPADPPPDTGNAVTPPDDPSPTNPGNLLKLPETPPDTPAEEEQTGGPTANDDHYDVEQNSGATSLSVTSNDSGTITAVQAASMPANGELDQTEMTSFSYTPNPDFVGSDSFTYQAKDANQATSNTATVTINVTSPTSSEVPDPSKNIQDDSGDNCENEPRAFHEGSQDGCFDPCDDNHEDVNFSGGNHEGCFDGCTDHDSDFSKSGGDWENDGCKKHHRHKKHHDDDDDDDDGRCLDDDHDGDHRKHHKHHDRDGDWHGDGDGDWNGDMPSSHGGDENWDGDNEWDKWKKDWNHDWDHDNEEDCDEDEDEDEGEGGDLPDTGSPINLPLLALSGLLVIAGVAVVRRTRA
jgi:LPXTG-motif cell wall-anchored protein